MLRLLFPLFVFATACGPDCKNVPGAPTCADTLAAAHVIDSVYVQHNLPAVSAFERFIWVSGPSFQYHGQTVGGVTRIRLASGAVVTKGEFCQTKISASSTHPFQTNEAHEMLHCAFFFKDPFGQGDPGHTAPEWKTLPSEANVQLYKAGL